MSEAAKKLDEAPKKKLDLGEKRAGEIDSQAWWTNFHVMFRGKLKGAKLLDSAKPDAMKRVYDEATKGAKLEPLEFVEFTVGKRDERLEVAVLRTAAGRRVLIQKVYFDYCASKEYALRMGNVTRNFGLNDHYVIAAQAGEIVGVIMPVRE